MSFLRQTAATPAQTTRLRVVQGHGGAGVQEHGPLVADPHGVVAPHAAGEAPLPSSPATPAQRRYRGLHLVTGAVMAAGRTSAQASADTFAHARRIVSQVEREIQQQASRERHVRLAGWSGAALPPAAIHFPQAAADPSAAPWLQAVDRLCRKLGF